MKADKLTCMTTTDKKIVAGVYAFFGVSLIVYLLGAPIWVVWIGCIPGIALFLYGYVQYQKVLYELQLTLKEAHRESSEASRGPVV